jgi:homocysteine S-methyltransferase
MRLAGARAVLFNCCQPGDGRGDHRCQACAECCSRAGGGVLVGAYANAFGAQTAKASANAELHDLRADLGPYEYLAWARQWLQEGAGIVGGCCGVGPEHIALIRDWLQQGPPQELVPLT